MKASVLFLCLTLCSACHIHRGTIPILYVIDGDTVAIDPSFLPLPLNTSPPSIRLRGIDCPESAHRAKCATEYNLAATATAFTKHQLEEHSSADTGIEICSWDKFGGRILGDVVFWKDGKLFRLKRPLFFQRRSLGELSFAAIRVRGALQRKGREA